MQLRLSCLEPVLMPSFREIKALSEPFVAHLDAEDATSGVKD